MKKVIITILMLVIAISIIPSFASAANTTKISISDSEITVDGKEIETDTNSSIYLTNKMDNGGTQSESISSNIEVANVININSPGIYEFTGTLSDGQISVNANNINGEVKIILNEVNITCKNAPAIFVYSKNPESENCKVTIELADGTTNNVVGGKIKQSVQGWEDQDSILYYVEKDYDDDKQYYERYKYDGAISSDISLTFEGTGTLNVTSSKKEGIESKMHITINNGTYNINSLDDAINACMDNKSIITINGGTVIANVLDEAEEGDGIDSNGYLYINGGTVYAFAHPGSDNGLDSDLGTYINGGTVFATGSMYEECKTSNSTKIVQMNLSKEVETGESIVIADEDENVVFAFKTDRKVSTVVYSSNSLEDKTYNIYTGTDIEGTIDENNIYTTISSIDLSKMTKQENNTRGGMPGENGRPQMNNQNNNSAMPNTLVGKITLVVLIITIISVMATGAITLCRTKTK